MEDRRTIYIVIVWLLLSGILGFNHINNLTNRIDELEKNIIGYEEKSAIDANQIQALEDQIDSLQTSVSTLINTVNSLNNSLESSQNNCTMLKEDNRVLERDVIDLTDQLDAIDEAMSMVGREEIKTLLMAYSETLEELADLQRQYDELMDEYNKLIE